MARKNSKKTVSMDDLKAFIRKEGANLLKQRNITSVGIGYKITDGQATDELSIQFTVGRKVTPEALESGELLPESFTIAGVEVPTDVLERNYGIDARAVRLQATLREAAPRKVAINPITPGVSIGHPSISAGTVGCVVYDAQTGRPYILSNWHVLSGSTGKIGDPIVQPGRHDDDRVHQNIVGRLVRSHLGIAGDCAIASIQQRRLSPEIVDLNVSVRQIGEPELGDRVVKSGRTTDVTFGIVNRVHTVSTIDYDGVGETDIGCFEIGPDPERPARNGEISMGGDSGSVWLFADDGTPSDMMLGLHFAGEFGDAPEHALACYPASVFKKLGIRPTPEVVNVEAGVGIGYSSTFVGSPIAVPTPATAEVTSDLLEVGGTTVFDYVHFSLALSRSRRFARWVAWNIDGGAIRRLSRNGIRFRKDPKLPSHAQIGNELYRHNPLDRGHIARRADLVWGTFPEAEQANHDSFFYTNIAPQHETFNQSSAGGIWGELENVIFSEVDVEDVRISVMAGPIFADDDQIYRDVQLPAQFWKIIYFREAGDPIPQAKGYILTQADLLNQLEVLALPEFSVFEVPITQINEMTGLSLASRRTLASVDCDENELEAIEEPVVRRISSIVEILK